jgi:hypothetical protein
MTVCHSVHSGAGRLFPSVVFKASNYCLHGVEDFQIEPGATLAEPKLVQGDRLMRFDMVLANPPYSQAPVDISGSMIDYTGAICPSS